MLLKIFFLLQLVTGTGDSSITAASGSVPTDTVLVAGPRGSAIIGSITLAGNKVTKPHIILRELTFKENDTIKRTDLVKEIEKSKENLLNTSLFNFVTIDTAQAPGGRTNIAITVTERWYTWPVPIFEIAERNFNTWWETRNFSKANYGFYLVRDNFRGRKESLSFKFRFGYSEQFGISYSVPYLNKKQSHGLGMGVSYTRTHEIPYKTINNKLLYFKNPDKYIRTDFSSRITYSYRQGHYNTHLAELRYYSGAIDDTVLTRTTDYFLANETNMKYLTAIYEFRRDFRDSKVYPLKGYYFSLDVVKMGLGLLKNEQLDIFSLEGTIKRYWPLPHRLYLASSVKGKVSTGTRQPYSVQRALGYSDYVRAYEYYVIDGQSYGLLKTSLRYELIKPRTQQIPYLRLEKFNKFHYAMYVGVFSDLGYVDDDINYQFNDLANTLLFGTGVGMDFVTYYDTIFRLEYSFNKRGENGVFIHFSSPI